MPQGWNFQTNFKDFHHENYGHYGEILDIQAG